MPKIFFCIAITLSLLLPAVVDARTRTSVFDEATRNLNTATSEAGLGEPAEVERGTARLVSTIINTVASLLAVIAVVLIVYAGGLWLTAAGNDQQVSKAKTILKQTIVGVFIVGFAYAITAFVFGILLPPAAPPAEEAPAETPVPTRVE